MKIPESVAGGAVAIDAYTGEATVTGRFAANYRAWALMTPKYGQPVMRPDPPDPKNWQDRRVGWGLILPEPPGRTTDQLAGAEDAPEPIQALLDARRGKVLRYRPGAKFADWTLRDYAGQGDVLNAASPMGAGPQQLPKYLLIYATPADVPWHVQFALNPVRCVGRLDLTGDALARYVRALTDDWADADAAYSSPVVWAVDHGGGDITALMRESVASAIFAELSKDPEMRSATFVDGSCQAATGAALRDALVANHPALVVTSSHGMTGPLSDVDMMRRSLGLPVDQEHRPVSPDDLLADWQPEGAIWFAQACCSAGTDSPSAYAGLFEPGTLLNETLTGIAQTGAITVTAAASIARGGQAAARVHRPRRANLRLDHQFPAEPAVTDQRPHYGDLHPAMRRAARRDGDECLLSRHWIAVAELHGSADGLRRDERRRGETIARHAGLQPGHRARSREHCDPR